MKHSKGPAFAPMLVVLLVSSCHSDPPPTFPQLVPYRPDGGVDAEVDSVPADCRVACESLAKLGCPEAEPAGRTCGSVCAVNSRYSDLRLDCVASSSTPDQVRGCCPVGSTGCAPTTCEGR